MSESPAKQDESPSENHSERDPTVRPELTDGTKAVTLPGATLQPAVRGAAGGLYPKIVLALLVATLLSLGAGAAVFRLVTYRTFNEIRIEVIKDLRRIVHHSYNEIAAQESNRNRIQRDLAEKFSSLRQIHIQVEPVPETAGTIDDVEVRQAGHGFVTWFDEGSNRVTIRGEGVIADLAPAVTRGFFASGMTIIMVVSACGAFVFSSVRRRLSRLIEAHDRVAAGNRESRIRDTIDDELGDLGRSFDQMVDDLAKHEARIDQLQSQRRDFLSDISHELKTPITSLRGHLEGMIGSSDPKRDPVHLIYEEAERLSRLVEDLLQLARFESDRFVMRREECVLQRIASRSVERLRIAAANRSVELLTDLAPEPVRRAVDPQRFEQWRTASGACVEGAVGLASSAYTLRQPGSEGGVVAHVFVRVFSGIPFEPPRFLCPRPGVCRIVDTRNPIDHVGSQAIR